MAGHASGVVLVLACLAAVPQLFLGANALKINTANERQLLQMDYGYGGFDATAYFSATVQLSGLSLADVEGTTIGDDLCDALVEAFEAAAPADTSAPLVCSTTFSADRRRSLLQSGVVADMTITTDGEVFTLDKLANMKPVIVEKLPGLIADYAKAWPVDVGDIVVSATTVTLVSEDGTLVTEVTEFSDDGTITVTTTTTTPDGTTTTTTTTGEGGGYGYGVKAASVVV